MADPRILNEFSTLNYSLGSIAESLGKISVSLSEIRDKIESGDISVGQTDSVSGISELLHAIAGVALGRKCRGCCSNASDLECGKDDGFEDCGNDGPGDVVEAEAECGEEDSSPSSEDSDDTHSHESAPARTVSSLPVAEPPSDPDNDVETLAGSPFDPKFVAVAKSLTSSSVKCDSGVEHPPLMKNQTSSQLSTESQIVNAKASGEPVATRKEGESPAEFFRRVVEAGLLPSSPISDPIELESVVQVDEDIECNDSE